MADDALFGPDGTQALTPFPLLADPLGGLVTGELPAGAEPAPLPDETPTVAPPAPLPPTGARYGTPGRGRPKRVSAVRTVQASGPPRAFATPPAIAPTRPASVQRPSRTATAGMVSVRDMALGKPRGRPPTGRSRRGRRSSGVAALIVFLIFIVIVAVIVLGIVSGHGAPGVDSGGG